MTSRVLTLAGTTEPSPLLADGLAAAFSARACSTAELMVRVARWERVRSGMTGFFAAYDLIVCPVAAVPAPLHGGTVGHAEAFSYCSVRATLSDRATAARRATARRYGLGTVESRAGALGA